MIINNVKKKLFYSKNKVIKDNVVNEYILTQTYLDKYMYLFMK